MYDATGAIQNAPNRNDFLWLYNEEGMIAGKRKQSKCSILTELGRVLQKDEQSFWEWATLLCKEKPKTHDAISSIRHWRLGK
jgi:hypothetical protein